eukprot:Lithocolla_globosa_v1_NODE_8766_length_782_cov_41.794239.p2 type:complete len:104 gc:universal NODE_8766_length_782_cov_41.794239:171-482(+)
MAACSSLAASSGFVFFNRYNSPFALPAAGPPAATVASSSAIFASFSSFSLTTLRCCSMALSNLARSASFGLAENRSFNVFLYLNNKYSIKHILLLESKSISFN